ncbi:2-C-methyl-D-erythritol 4-phosphate cytidylyltransferase [Comamonas nitrativorans]|uniref:2-C-methyl-D-erythritol 4-phosphate cytidylyltransferase n=1 Tax=Comamonas nitrativorans TaxID=108437 RepID=A0ABV9H2I7_9BURK|nr:2-C-methyl-D-erythritol 4-phosphate cytidylyltransferase [Comamonas sp.]
MSSASLAPSPFSSSVPDRNASRFWGVIPCAGNGTRAVAPGMGDPALPKQYQRLLGQPLVLHTLAAFAAVPQLVSTLVAVAPGDDFLNAYPGGSYFTVPCGGATRAQTVLGALRALQQRGAQAHDWVLVHDAARCLVTPLQIETLIAECQHDSVGGLLAHKIPDTLKTAVTGPGGVRVVATLERSDKWLAQTPQMFRLEPLLHALEKLGDAATDEASAMEAAGHRPKLVAGGAQNFKVTYPEDFALASAVLAYREGSSTTARFGESPPTRPERGNRFF